MSASGPKLFGGVAYFGFRIRVRVSIGGRVRVRFWLGPGT